MWEPVAFCCFTRRTGCLVLASLEVIAATISLIFGMFLLLVSKAVVYDTVCRQDMMEEGNCEQYLGLAVNTALGITMIIAVVQLVCSSLMIHGIRKNNHCLMVPFLIKYVITVGLNIIACSVLVAFLCVTNFLAMLLVAYCYGALIFMWTYFLLTARAYYYEVKRGKVDDHHILVENCELENGGVNK